jgi:phosphatidate cytidylyltransferase
MNAVTGASETSSRPFWKLGQRLQSGLLFTVLLVAVAFWLPPVALLLLLLLFCGIAQWEFYALLDHARIPHFKRVGLVAGLALVAATWFSLRYSAGKTADGEWFVLVASVLALFVRQFPQKHNPQPLQTLGTTLLGIMYVPFLINFFSKLLLSWGETEGRLLLLYLVLVVKMNDVGAYFIGCRYGRHKLIPRISPGKSWEGSLGGLVAGVLASLLIWLVSGGNLGVVNMCFVDALVLGIALSVCGSLGDLAESLLKRAVGVKDSGRIILGMGGVLDVLDSLLFAAPVLYVYTQFFMERL